MSDSFPGDLRVHESFTDVTNPAVQGDVRVDQDGRYGEKCAILLTCVAFERMGRRSIVPSDVQETASVKTSSTSSDWYSTLSGRIDSCHTRAAKRSNTSLNLSQPKCRMKGVTCR